ncbi:serine/threonine-protein kinase/endoribonuclease IRE1-like [Xenia sp. Carnegie-2017]|uniref:serine/threonine-protein kinase/endoribonuclease IRE1-like n=1 Tax=Xenia sp. Carnegie-2017 TaxID=2897299 RepID=UPI001F03F832|nr:serine/threonine-protein kinase/endoribonuclease IRE1-like [Xenia sp. Carnegie-2017]
MLNGNPVGLDEINDETLKDLLSWMLKLQPEERPSANEALTHPFLCHDEKFHFYVNIETIHHDLCHNQNHFIRLADKAYFIKTFPVFFVRLHAAVRSNEDLKNKPKLKEQWKYIDESTKHRELLLKLIEYGRNPTVEVKVVGNVRVIFSEEFCIGEGSDATRVYLGLGKDGYGKAVKRIHRYKFVQLAHHKKKILNKFNAKKSKYVVNYFYLEEDTGTEYVYLILDLCEESLESFVKSSTLNDLQKALPDILRQILKGLADLHRCPNPILHRDLRPSNVLRDSKSKFLIADFGISRILKDDSTTYESNSSMGTVHWIAPESYCEDDDSGYKACYNRRSDVYNAGMVAYYVATKGKHPFGTKLYRQINMLKGNPVGLDEIEDETLKDLLSWMLNLKPEDRPYSNEALKHPFLMSDDEKFQMLCKVGNLQQIKTNDPQSSVVQKLNSESVYWKSQMDWNVYDYFRTYEENGKISKVRYKSSWPECLRFIRNIDQHWNDLPRPLPQPEPFYKIGDYRAYFLRTFPNLPVQVHAAVRSNEELKTNQNSRTFLILMKANYINKQFRYNRTCWG